MIDATDWANSKRQFPIGARVTGAVIHVEPYGVFIEVSGCHARTLLLVTEFEDSDRKFDLADYPEIGEIVSAVVVDHVEHNHEILVSRRRSTIERQLGRR